MNYGEYDIIRPEDIATVEKEMKVLRVSLEEPRKPAEKGLDYSSFINGLLNNPNSTKQDRERIVELLLKERDKGFVTKEQVEQMILEFKGDGGGTIKYGSKHFHDPKRMIGFLYQFSKNDSYKWFTHAPDATNQDFDYEAYVENAKRGFQAIAKGINQYTWNNVYNFIFDTKDAAKDSFNNDIKIRWKDLKVWCMEHRFMHPYYELVDDYTFERYITIFKNTIEFRTDDNNMIFANRIEDFMYDFAIKSSDISLEFLDSFYSIGGSLRVYIDVRQLFTAFVEIGKWIVSNKSKSNKVEFSLDEAEDRYVFSIFHKGSFMNIDDEKLKGLSGDFHKIRNILLNVADWTIEADVKDSSLHIVCLDSQTEYNLNDRKKATVSSANKLEAAQQKIGGVKHIITLYKNIQS